MLSEKKISVLRFGSRRRDNFVGRKDNGIMQVVVIKPPKIIGGILRLIFKIKKPNV